MQIEEFSYAEPLIPYVNEYALLITRDDFADGKPFRVDTKYNQIPEHIKQIYRPYFAAIKPAPAVQKRIDAAGLPQNATRRSRFFLRLPRISPFTQVPLALKADFFAFKPVP